MLRTLITPLIVALLLLPTCTPRRTHPSVSAEEGLPLLSQTVPARDFSLPTSEGETITLSELRGNVVFLYFWATW